ncbi:MAG: SAM-dependent methyltransferase [Lachnospiraceae bacterium]|nr:SAM-dependent methyltransferase [Lachnospiraceae bacterium]
MSLSKRLLAATELVTKGNTVADIGCDHAYTSIYLCSEGIAPRVFAMDVNEGPLLAAGQHVAEARLEDRITIRRSDGLAALVPGEAETILLCGMGGLLMMRILTDHPEVTESAKELILQPQSEVGQVRHFLHNMGYEIAAERMVKEDGKFYVMMRAVKSEIPQGYESECCYEYGKLLIEEKNEVLKEFLQREHRLRTEVLTALAMQDTEHVRARRESLSREFTLISEAERLMKEG